MIALEQESLTEAPLATNVQAGADSTPSDASGNAGANADAERRTEFRYTTSDPVDVAPLEMPGLQVSGILRDVSKSGLRIELAVAVSAGARLKVSLHKRTIMFVVVRYCRKTGDAYQVGASIEHVYYPSTTSISPDCPEHSNLECGEVARLIVRHHTSGFFPDSDAPRSRLSPVSEGVI
jgi:hypothetical protein